MKFFAAGDFNSAVAGSALTDVSWQSPTAKSQGLWHSAAWPLALICSFLIFVIGSSAYLVISSQFTGELVNRALRVQNKIAVVLATVRDAESGQRGYLLTGDSDYLDVYRTAADNVLTAIGDLDGAVVDQGQKTALAEMKTLVERKFDEMNGTIQLNSAGKSAAALAIVRTGVGRDLMTRVSALAAVMLETEQHILTVRASNSLLTSRLLLAVNLIGLGLVIALSMIFVLVMRRVTKKELAYLAELQRSNQELDDFAYIASHDLKEPLRGLFNHAQFLLEDYKDKLDEDGVRRLNRLGALSQRMEKLINDLMYFSRLGRADLAMEETDINAMIADIQQTMDVFIDERHAQIDVPLALPSIVCDRARTAEVFRNLITNGVKYNDNVKPTVEIGFKESAVAGIGVERNVFYVKDNGVGIETDFHQEIFRIFKRLQNSSKKETGTGAGLTFVKKIVEREGGRVWLDSEVGKGTTFYFTLTNRPDKPKKEIDERGPLPFAVHSAG